MPNSTELRLVIQTSTVNCAHAERLARFGAALLSLRDGGSVAALSTVTARSSTSALASCAASAAAASASSATALLPSAMPRSPCPKRRERGTDGANRELGAYHPLSAPSGEL